MATVSSTDGSPTNTCWNRRSRAGSFSMRSRYSSSVVAPTRRSSPRASMGLSMLPASMAPSPPAPAPTTVCSSSMKVTTSPFELVISCQDGLEPLLELAAVLGAGHHRGQVERDQPLAAQRLGHVAGDDALGEALDDGGLADAGLADQHRVVLGAAGQHLHHAADLGVAADDRVELAVARALRQVDAVLLERLVRALGVGGRHARGAAHGRQRGGERVARRTRGAQGVGHAGLAGGEAEQQVLGRDVVVTERAGLGEAASSAVAVARDAVGWATVGPARRRQADEHAAHGAAERARGRRRRRRAARWPRRPPAAAAR